MIQDRELLKVLFDAGDLLEAEVHRAEQAGWKLLFRRRSGDPIFLNGYRSDSPKVMKKLDTVRTTLEKIGFSKATWVMN